MKLLVQGPVLQFVLLMGILLSSSSSKALPTDPAWFDRREATHLARSLEEQLDHFYYDVVYETGYEHPLARQAASTHREFRNLERDLSSGRDFSRVEDDFNFLDLRSMPDLDEEWRYAEITDRFLQRAYDDIRYDWRRLVDEFRGEPSGDFFSCLARDSGSEEHFIFIPGIGFTFGHLGTGYRRDVAHNNALSNCQSPTGPHGRCFVSDCWSE
jgi:hypothetical protein